LILGTNIALLRENTDQSRVVSAFCNLQIFPREIISNQIDHSRAENNCSVAFTNEAQNGARIVEESKRLIESNCIGIHYLVE
jgi:hypothetical protein